MKISLTLFPYDSPAKDGSVIPRQVIQEYLETDDYRDSMRNRIAIGGITHKDRFVKDEDKEKIGPDDLVLLNDNGLHVITKIYIKEDGFVWCDAEIFDEEDFDESDPSRRGIRKIKGFIRKKVMLPNSVVIKAYWDVSEKCNKIILIKGFDWTFNPSFKGSELKTVNQDA